MNLTPLMRLLSGLAAIVAAGSGLFVLASWKFGQWPIATFGPEYVPMAPSTGILFALLGGGIAVRVLWPQGGSSRLAGMAAATVAFIVAALAAAQSLSPIHLPWDGWLVPSPATVSLIPIGLMAPLTAFTFVLSAGALMAVSFRRGEQPFPRWIASLCAVVAFLIGAVVVAGYASGTPLQYGAQTVPMALLTGLAFMALNFSILLFASAQKQRQSWFATDSVAPIPQEIRLLTQWLMVAGIAIGGVIALAGFYHLRREQTAARETAGEELDAIANLKAEQIVAWRNERLGEARFLLRARGVVEDIAAFAAHPDNPMAREHVVGWLEPIKGGSRYESVMVFDPQARPLLNISDPDAPTQGPSQESFARALASREVVFTDLHRDPGGTSLHLDLLIPLRTSVGLNSGTASPSAVLPFAVVVLRLNPRQFLFPLIKGWPVPSKTAENVLERRVDEEVVFLNEFNEQPQSALSLRRSINDPMLPAALAARGAVGRLEGRDHFGVPVLATIRRIPDSSWLLICQIAQTEIYAPLRRAALLNGLVVASLLLALAFAGFFVWRQRHANYLRRVLAAERDRNALSERLALITRHANDIIILFDNRRRIVEANERALVAYGRTLAEIRQLHADDLRPTGSKPAVESDYQATMLLEGVTFETSHQRKNGFVFPVEVSARTVVIEGCPHVLSIIRDITERKSAEEQLRRSEESLATTLQSIGDAVIATDANSLITRMNPMAERLTGWTLAEAAGRPLPEVFRIVNADTRAPTVDPAQRVMERGGIVGLANHTALLSRDGREYLISDSAAPIRDASGRVAGVVLVFSDMTEKYRVQNALRVAEEKFRRTFELMPDPLTLESRDGVLLNVSDVFCEFTGFLREQLVGRSVPELQLWTDPQQRLAMQEALQRDGRVDGLIAQLRHRNGDIRTMQLSARFLILQPEPVLLTVAHDITAQTQAELALRASEQRYRSILNASPDDITLADLTGRINMVSPAGMRMFGYENDHEFVGRLVTEFLVPEDRPKAAGKIALMFQGAMPGVNEYHGRRRDGSIFDLEVNSEFVRDAAGKPINIIFVARDVTARKRAEATLRSTLLEKEALLMEVHHRVKNNLQVITSLLRLEAGRSTQPATKSVLGDMQGRIRSMAMLHEALYRSGSFAAIDLSVYLKQITTQLVRALVTVSTDVRLHLDLATVAVEMDQAMPCGLLVNELVSNSLKHGFPEGRSGEVRVELHWLNDGARVSLTVSDNGAGLPPEFASNQRQSLGLQLVGDLTRQLEGTLEIGAGPGARFTVTFTPRLPAPIAPFLQP